MKRLAAVLLTALAIPACAQHSGVHAGGAPHSAPSFHAGSAAPSAHGFGSGRSAPRSFGSAPRMNWNGPRSTMPRNGVPAHFAMGPTFGVRTPAGRAPGPGLHRPPYDPSHGSGDHHERDRNRRGSPFRPFYYENSTYLVPGYLGYGYPANGYDDSGDGGYVAGSGQDMSNNGGYGDDVPYQDADPGARAPYPQSYPEQAGNAPLAAPVADPVAVTLVFNDGRASEQIHNYALTRTTLYVLDAHHRDIPLTQLDIVATQKANQDSGIDFRLPVTVN